jgi:hypothetical protein
VRRFFALLFASCWLAWGAGSAEARRFLESIDSTESEVLDDLYNGRIVWAERFSNDNMNETFKVQIEHQGRRRWALFKPRSFGDGGGWNRVPMEAAMYKLSRVLGMDVVPPTAYRRNIDVDFRNFAEGSLMLWIDDAHNVLNVPEHEWSPQREAFSSDLRVLQAIGSDGDFENRANYKRGRSWREPWKYRAFKIDNAAAGLPGASITLEQTHPLWGPITRFNRTTYDRLRELTFADLKMDVGEFLSDAEIHRWLGIANGVVQKIDGEQRQRGNVFFQPHEIGYNADRPVGAPADAPFVRKFEALMKRKGVTVRYFAPGAPELAKGVGRTVLTTDHIEIRLARPQNGVLHRGTLIEEQVHANQLLAMARRTGGLRQLHRALGEENPYSHLIGLSMEEYAKGRVGLLTGSPATETASPRTGPTLWRSVPTPPRSVAH